MPRKNDIPVWIWSFSSALLRGVFKNLHIQSDRRFRVQPLSDIVFRRWLILPMFFILRCQKRAADHPPVARLRDLKQKCQRSCSAENVGCVN